MKTTLKDISDYTGLSISTVSRVLGGKAKRNSKNVQKIIDAAKRLNYPIYLDSSNDLFKRKENILVALITNFHVGEFYASFYDGFTKAERDSKVRIGLFNSGFDLNDTIELINLLSVNSYDGAILFLPALVENEYEQIVAATPKNFALISVATVLNPVLDTITFDSYRGGYLVAKHFFEQGYKDVGIILGTTVRNESLLRKSGFGDFVQHHSDMKLIWQVEGDYTIESGRAMYDEYKKLTHKPRAIFVSNDYMCLGFMERAREDGINIPNDLALASFDDLPICEFHYPTITSVRTNYENLAKSAIDLIQEKFEKPAEHHGQLRIVPVQLSVRDSSQSN
ncbi:MAG: LacI family transcriptional regulator [Balneolales bacterium]|nr:LacI family transcriptional regulator [Balneolales bacterium]